VDHALAAAVAVSRLDGVRDSRRRDDRFRDSLSGSPLRAIRPRRRRYSCTDAPTERLVVGGAYGYVRNPMYLAVLTIIVGQALLLGQPHLLTYAGVVAAIMVTFVRVYEEPVLSRKFGREYEDYRRQVRGWWPRLQKPYRNRT
jgi:protein-S-isoprenylcysteine O-methyltransferase Ste14